MPPIGVERSTLDRLSLRTPGVSNGVRYAKGASLHQGQAATRSEGCKRRLRVPAQQSGLELNSSLQAAQEELLMQQVCY